MNRNIGPEASNTDVEPVASHSSGSSNSIEQWRRLPFKEEYLDNRAWHPGKPKDYTDKSRYHEALKEWQEAEDRVLFKNIAVDYDSCDCGDGYGCSHGSWPYNIRIIGHDHLKITYEDSEQLYMESGNKCITLNGLYNLTIGDFYEACKFLGVSLTLNSDPSVQASVASKADKKTNS